MFSVNVLGLIFYLVRQDRRLLLNGTCCEAATDSSTLFTRCHGAGDTLARSSSAGQLDTYITPSPHHPWPAGGWGWCEAAWRQAGLLTTHYTALHCTGHTDTGHGGFGEMRSGH